MNDSRNLAIVFNELQRLEGRISTLESALPITHRKDAPSGGLIEQITTAMQQAPYSWEDKFIASVQAMVSWLRRGDGGHYSSWSEIANVLESYLKANYPNSSN